MPPNRPTDRDIARNRKARFNYELDDPIEAGIVLTGTEVKSLRAGRANIEDAYASLKDGEVWLWNMFIPEYGHGNRYNHEPRRGRKLLLHRRQIRKLIGELQVQGTTLVPLALYFGARGYAKVQLAVGRGKKQFEKRETIKERDWKRQKERLLKQ